VCFRVKSSQETDGRTEGGTDAQDQYCGLLIRTLTNFKYWNVLLVENLTSRSRHHLHRRRHLFAQNITASFEINNASTYTGQSGNAKLL